MQKGENKGPEPLLLGSEEAETKQVKRERYIPSGRVQTLDGMRLFIQLWIILGHYWKNRKEKENYLHRFVSRAGVAVTFYIVLSGIMTYVGYRNSSLEEYYARRLTPMILLHELALLVSIHWFSDFGDWLSFWRSFLMLDVWYDRFPSKNGPLWTLETLMACWLVFPLISNQVKKASKMNRVKTTAILFLFIAIPWTICSPMYFDRVSLVRSAPYFRIVDFTLGMVAASLFLEGYGFASKYSWLWFYVPDVCILTIIAILSFSTCETYGASAGDEGCRDTLSYTLMEGPIGVALWTLVIYGFFYKHEVKNVGIFRRIFNHDAPLTLARGGIAFCAYCLQSPFADWIVDTYPITYLLALWSTAIVVNDFILLPVSSRIRKHYKDLAKKPLKAIPHEDSTTELSVQKEAQLDYQTIHEK